MIEALLDCIYVLGRSAFLAISNLIQTRLVYFSSVNASFMLTSVEEGVKSSVGLD